MPQDVLAALATYDGIIMVGSGGCGKSRAGRELMALAEPQYGEGRVVRCANSGFVAAHTGCVTFARAMRAGQYDATRSSYSCEEAAQAVASYRLLIIEEVTAIPARLLWAHFKVRSLGWSCSKGVGWGG